MNSLIKWRDLPLLQLLIIIHILHLHVIYHQYLTLMTAYSRGAVQAGFSIFFLLFFASQYPKLPVKSVG